MSIKDTIDFQYLVIEKALEAQRLGIFGFIGQLNLLNGDSLVVSFSKGNIFTISNGNLCEGAIKELSLFENRKDLIQAILRLPIKNVVLDK